MKVEEAMLFGKENYMNNGGYAQTCSRNWCHFSGTMHQHKEGGTEFEDGSLLYARKPAVAPVESLTDDMEQK